MKMAVKDSNCEIYVAEVEKRIVLGFVISLVQLHLYLKAT